MLTSYWYNYRVCNFLTCDLSEPVKLYINSSLLHTTNRIKSFCLSAQESTIIKTVIKRPISNDIHIKFFEESAQS